MLGFLLRFGRIVIRNLPLLAEVYAQLKKSKKSKKQAEIVLKLAKIAELSKTSPSEINSQVESILMSLKEL